VKTYEEHKAEVAERRKRVWTKLLNHFPSGRAPGNRPRDPEQEQLLIRAARKRLARRDNLEPTT